MQSVDPAELSRWYSEATFVFRGHVVEMGASNIRHIPASRDTATVRVDEVLNRNDLMGGFCGEVTVALDATGKGPLERGSAAVFFAKGVVYGETVGVRALGFVAPSGQLLDTVAALAERASRRPLELRVAHARLVIAGRVVGLRACEKAPSRRLRHDPDWWTADVQVLSVLRGEKRASTVQVLFANHGHVGWRKAPKLRAGETGILLLHAIDLSPAPPGVTPETYAVIDPLDVVPTGRLDDVQSAIAKATGGAEGAR